MSETPGRTELALEDLHWLRALAARLVRDPHLADDAVQDTLVAALERRPRAKDSLRAWLGTVLRNVLRQEWRARTRRARREARADAPLDERSTLEVVEELALHRRLVERVQALDEPYRTAVLLRYLRGLEVADIARELSVPEKTVRTRLARALEQLRRRMGSEREAWALMLLPPRSPCLPPAIPALLLPMNLKAVVAVVVVCLVGALVYTISSQPERARIEAGADTKVAAEAAASRSVLDTPTAPGHREAQPIPSRAPAAAPAARPEVQGFVRSLDGRGLADVEVVFEQGERGSYTKASSAPGARTGPAGEFALNCPERAGRLDVRSDEFVGVVLPQLDGSVPLSPPIIVAAPLRNWSGVVIDERREPIASARVEITLAGSFVQSRDVGGQSVHLLLPFAETKCDAHGAFSFERAGFVDGAHFAVGADGFVEARVPLPAASSFGLEITLARKASGPRTIVGRVVDAREAPVAGARVSLGGPSVESDAEGRFRIDSEAWRKTGWIRAFQPGTLPAEMALEKALEEIARERQVLLKLGAEPRSIRGRVLDADGNPVAGASVWTPDTTPFGEIVVQEGEHSFTSGSTVEALLSGNRDPWAAQVSAKTGADGGFVIAGLLERDYMLFALDARTLEGLGPLEARAGDENVVIRLGRTPRATVAGRVVSRAGVPLAGVTVTPGRRFDWRVHDSPGAARWAGFAIMSPHASQTFPAEAVVTDSQGRFELGPIVPHGTFLALRGKPLVLGDAFELEGAAQLGALEIAVDASSRFRIVLAREAEADAFRLESAEGEQVPLFLEVEGVTISAAKAGIERGRSGVVMASEGEHVVVLLAGAEEVRKVLVRFPAGGLHELEP